MKYIPNGVSSRASVAALKLSKHSPRILFAGGLVLGAATVVTACRATLKVEKTMQEKRNHVEWARTADDLTDNDRRKEVAIAYGVTARKLTVLYGPSFVLGVASVACLTQSHRILMSRNAALGAAYTALDKAYESYRGRVREELGEDRERELYRDVRENIEVVKTKSGEKEVVRKTASGIGGSPYKVLFDEFNRNWDSNGDYRFAFLRAQQSYWNDKLKADGYVILNDVLASLGFPKTTAGAVVGWVDGKYKESKDGFVDFGIFGDRTATEFLEFVAYGEAIWLDFNVDGAIYELLDKIGD